MDTVKNLTILAYKSEDEYYNSSFNYRVFPIDKYGVTTTDIISSAEYIHNLKEEGGGRYGCEFTFLFDGREAEDEGEKLLTESILVKVMELDAEKAKKLREEKEAQKLKEIRSAKKAERAQYEALKKKFEGSAV